MLKVGGDEAPCESKGKARAFLWVSLCVLLVAIMLPTFASYVAG